MLRHSLILPALLAVAARGSATPPALRTMPFRAVGSTILLPAVVNGSERGWFILDSGANSCVLDKDFAKRVGLHPVVGGQATGAGKGTVPYDRYSEQVQFSVSGLALDCPGHVIGLDLSNQPSIIGAKVDGILGTDFFAHYVLEVDYSRQVVRAYAPGSFRYTGRGAHVPLVVDSKRLPHVDAALTVDRGKTAKRRILVDTGSQDAVDDDWILHARDLHVGRGGVGLGQTFETKLGRFSAIQIGPYTVKNVLAFAGGVPLVGGEILRHFAIIFDWPRKQLIMEPGAGFARALGDSGAAGFGLSANADGTARIESIVGGSPAARAGLAVGDVITAVDGTATAQFQLANLVELFRRDRSYGLDVLRRGAPLHIALVL
jgi:hypothetical protein